MNAPLSPPTVAPLHPVRKACIEAAIKLNDLQFDRVRGEANDDDCRRLLNDGKAIIERVVIPMLEAYAAYVQRETGVDVSDLPTGLHDSMNDTLHLLELKARDLAEWEHEIAADPRGYAKAVRLGVD